MRRLFRQIFNWVIFFAVIAHLFSCVFMGQSFMPDLGF